MMQFDNNTFRKVLRSKYSGKFSINQIFGHWVVIDDTIYTPSYNNQGLVYLRCSCIDCGKEYMVQNTGLFWAEKNKKGGCRSCARKRNTEVGNKHINWKGYGDIPKSYVNNISSAAKRRGIEFNVSIEYIWNLYLEQKGKCKLSGTPIEFKKKDITASLDRIDRTKPYVEGNVQWVHKIINEMKWAKDDADFIKWCKVVAEFNKES